MSPALLLLATPLFGLTLELDAAYTMPQAPMVAFAAAMGETLELDAAATADTGSSADDSAAITPAAAAETLATDESEAPANDVGAQMARRARMARIHRAFGMSTWAAMTVTEVLGTIRYYNLYGFFAPQSRTPCVTGDAIGGTAGCTGQPVLHAVSSGLTATLYYTTFGLSYAMPDPLGLDQGEGEAARRLRRHKRLRWAHFSGMAMQALLGVVIANDQAFHVDRANHYRALQALSTVHMAVGYATYATLTWSGAIMMRR